MSDKIKEEENLNEIIKNISKEEKKEVKLSKEAIEKLKKEAAKNIDFEAVMNEVDSDYKDYRVIFVDGNEELVFDHGEFFLFDTIDARKAKRKIKRQEATEKYVEYFIRYQLNPIIEQKKIDNMSKNIIKTDKIVSKEKKTIEKTKTVVKEEKVKKVTKENLSR